MRDFISRTDAIFRLRRRQMDDDETYHNIDYHKTWDDAISVVKHLSCPDVVEVVRCQECKFLHLSSLEKWCWNEDSICYAGRVTDAWYCADGKPKEDTESSEHKAEDRRDA